MLDKRGCYNHYTEEPSAIVSDRVIDMCRIRCRSKFRLISLKLESIVDVEAVCVDSVKDQNPIAQIERNFEEISNVVSKFREAALMLNEDLDCIE